MAVLLDMNREEREQYVIQLYKDGKTVRQIAGLVHMSFRDIGIITNKVKLQTDLQRGYTNSEESKSSESQAFKQRIGGRILFLTFMQQASNKLSYIPECLHFHT